MLRLISQGFPSGEPVEDENCRWQKMDITVDQSHTVPDQQSRFVKKFVQLSDGGDEYNV
jgi:hypothetical protein